MSRGGKRPPDRARAEGHVRSRRSVNGSLLYYVRRASADFARLEEEAAEYGRILQFRPKPQPYTGYPYEGGHNTPYVPYKPKGSPDAK